MGWRPCTRHVAHFTVAILSLPVRDRINMHLRGMLRVLTGGEVESSQPTALHSRDAFEDMADHLAHAKDEKEA